MEAKFPPKKNGSLKPNWPLCPESTLWKYVNESTAFLLDYREHDRDERFFFPLMGSVGLPTRIIIPIIFFVYYSYYYPEVWGLGSTFSNGLAA